MNLCYHIFCSVTEPLFTNLTVNIFFTNIWSSQINISVFTFILIIIAIAIVITFALKLFIKPDASSKKRNQHKELIFKKLYNNSPVMLHSINLKGELVYVNDYWLKTLGYERDEVIGCKSEEFFTGALRNDYREHFQTLLNEGVLKNYEAAMTKKDGSSIYVNLTAELFYDNKGNPIQSFTTIMDITDRKKAEEQILEGKHKLDSILNNAVEAIFVLQNAKIRYANPATINVLGYTPGELFQTPFQEILYFEDKSWVNENYKKRMRGEHLPQQYSFRVIKKNNQVIWVEINAVYLLWDGKPAVLIFLIDITERKKHEDMLIQKTRELFKKNEQAEKLNKEIQKKNRALEENQEELRDYADELQAALEEVAVKNQKIEDTHADMLASIEYARIIQEAVLQTGDELEGIFENFILYKPKDIVSGDFYFFKKLNDLYIFAVGDCTGHGVPGGFITMLSVNLLQEVIIHSDLRNTANILENLRIKMKNVFHYSRHLDGMDLALCVYDSNKKEIIYSGANLAPMLISGGEQISFTPVFNPIGFYIKEDPFITQKYTVKNGDYLYLFSDGYKDQFGGAKSKKYQSRRLKQLLQKNNQKPAWEQKQILLNEHIRWKKNESQLDDITIVGIKLS